MPKSFVLYLGRPSNEAYHLAREEFLKAKAELRNRDARAAAYHLTEATNALDTFLRTSGKPCAGFRVQILYEQYLMAAGAGNHREAAECCARLADQYDRLGKPHECEAYRNLALTLGGVPGLAAPVAAAA